MTTGPYCAAASVETPTFRVSISASIFSRKASAVFAPTGTTTGSAMQRSPAEPKAAPEMSFTAWSRSASGMTMPWFLAPPMAWTRLPCRRAARIDVVGDVGGADEADRLDVRVVEDGVHRDLVAVHHVQHALGRAGLHHQLGQAHRHATGPSPRASG